MIADDSLPDDVETLKRLVRAGEADLARARAEASSAAALIAHLRLTIEKMRREIYGPRSERKVRLLEQLELELEELEAAAAEDDLAAEKVAASASDTTAVRGFTREKPSRKPFPAHLPRERVIVPGPTACACCGSTRLAKLGDDVTESLNRCRGNGRWCSTSERSSPAELVRRYRKLQPRSTFCPAASPGRACWP
jgi:transposase